MKEWLSRMRGVATNGLTWAGLWALASGLIWIVDRRGSMNERWLGPGIGIQTGLACGLVFSVALAIASGWRRLEESPPSRVLACGAIAGLLVGLLPFAINTPASEVPLWQMGAVVIGSMTLLGAVSAAVSLAMARKARAGRP